MISAPSVPPPPTLLAGPFAWIAQFVGALLLSLSAPAQEVTQEFLLRPGWNAVFVEVTPAATDPAVVFAGLPIESVWARSERVTTADFVRNQNEVAWNDSDWRVFRPPDLPGAFASTLHAVLANRAYLIHSRGPTPTTWRIRGTPSLRHPAWVPDAFNLRGFPIDAANPPTVLAFFRASTAHYDLASGRLEPFYRLGQDGQWRELDPTDRMIPGEALWVKCRGASTFVAPLLVRTDLGQDLDFGPIVGELPLRVVNLRGEPSNLRVVPLSNSAHSLWSVFSLTPTNSADATNAQPAWNPIGTELRRTLTPGVPNTLRLAPRRSLFTLPRISEVLALTDGSGARWLVPMSAERSTETNPAPTLHPHAGLWIGSARVQRVAEANQPSTSPPTPARSSFTLRLLLHVDERGRARLLQEVIQLWEVGTSETRPDGVRVPVEPGRYVLFSDPSLGSGFAGATLRQGIPVSRRLSTADFDFTDQPAHTLELEGTFEPNSRLEATYRIPPNARTNPFRHPYHPDHDNLDARFSAPTVEAYDVHRRLSLVLQPQDPTGFSDPDYGHAVLGGIFRETITGLHHQALRVEGDFRLRRVSDSPVLNPQPRARVP